VNLYEFCRTHRGRYSPESVLGMWLEVGDDAVRSQFAKWLANLQDAGIVEIIAAPTGFNVRVAGGKFDGQSVVSVLRIYSDAVAASFLGGALAVA
jgi:hypothetical protein